MWTCHWRLGEKCCSLLGLWDTLNACPEPPNLVVGIQIELISNVVVDPAILATAGFAREVPKWTTYHRWSGCRVATGAGVPLPISDLEIPNSHPWRTFTTAWCLSCVTFFGSCGELSSYHTPKVWCCCCCGCGPPLQSLDHRFGFGFWFFNVISFYYRWPMSFDIDQCYLSLMLYLRHATNTHTHTFTIILWMLTLYHQDHGNLRIRCHIRKWRWPSGHQPLQLKRLFEVASGANKLINWWLILIHGR